MCCCQTSSIHLNSFFKLLCFWRIFFLFKFYCALHEYVNILIQRCNLFYLSSLLSRYLTHRPPSLLSSAGTRPWSSSSSPTPSWGSLCPRPWVSSVWWWRSLSCSPCKSLKPGPPWPPHHLPPQLPLFIPVSFLPCFLFPSLSSSGGRVSRAGTQNELVGHSNRQKKLRQQYLQLRVQKWPPHPTFLCSRAYFCFAEVLCKTSLQLAESVQNKWLG